MNKVKWILGLSIWVAILPFLGFPKTFKNILIFASSLTITYLGYMLLKSLKKGKAKAKKIFENFSENKVSADKFLNEENSSSS